MARTDWDRALAIFGNPSPPAVVWQRQFDDDDETLKRLARTPHEHIDFRDLWYYHHDLAYVELQPDLFDYLFPACLVDWLETLRNNQPCSHGDSDFHKGLFQGRVLETRMTPERREAVFAFFTDGLLERLDAERGFASNGSATPAYGWIGRLNSLGIIMPGIRRIWEPWWSVETPGRSVCTIQYASDLMYPEGENPLFPAWTREQGGGGPYIWQNDTMIYDAGWDESNLEFLRSILTVDSVTDLVLRAADRLEGEPEAAKARQVADDLGRCRDQLSTDASSCPNCWPARTTSAAGPPESPSFQGLRLVPVLGPGEPPSRPWCPSRDGFRGGHPPCASWPVSSRSTRSSRSRAPMRSRRSVSWAGGSS
ncbi:MAG: hypothetical protein U0800_26370 [Isosphaeraceae bacterium]